MAIVVNITETKIERRHKVFLSNITIDAYVPQDFKVKVHADVTDADSKLGEKMKNEVLAEQARLNKEAAVQSGITVTELQTIFDA